MNFPDAKIYVRDYRKDGIRRESAFSIESLAASRSESLCLFLGELILEVVLLVRQDPCFGEEVILFAERFLHALQIPTQVIFVRKALHSWVVVYPLVRLHFLYSEWLDARISPIQVPIRIFIIIQLEVQLPASFLDHPVLGLSRAKDHLRRQLLLLP